MRISVSLNQEGWQLDREEQVSILVPLMISQYFHPFLLTRLSRMDYPTLISRTSPFLNLWVVCVFFLFFQILIKYTVSKQ